MSIADCFPIMVIIFVLLSTILPKLIFQVCLLLYKWDLSGAPFCPCVYTWWQVLSVQGLAWSLAPGRVSVMVGGLLTRKARGTKGILYSRNQIPLSS